MGRSQSVLRWTTQACIYLERTERLRSPQGRRYERGTTDEEQEHAQEGAAEALLQHHGWNAAVVCVCRSTVHQVGLWLDLLSK